MKFSKKQSKSFDVVLEKQHRKATEKTRQLDRQIHRQIKYNEKVAD